MNTFDLLDKLNLPVKIGLEGDEAMLNRMTIMDAYLSAAALQSNRGSSVNSYSWSYNDRTPDFLFSQPQQDFGGISQFDLFKLIGADGKPVDQEDSNDTRISLDLSKFKDLWQIESDDRKQRIGKSQDDSKGHDQVDTESDSYNRFEIDLKQEAKLDNKRTEKKPEKSEISNLINDERRRLLKKLNSCDDDRIVFKRREKNSKKDPKANTETYRGSRFWGVSKKKQIQMASYDYS